MRTWRTIAPTLACLILVGATGSIPITPHPKLTAFGAIDQGRWRLREKDGSDAGLLLCVSNARLLFQLHHGDAACSQLVIDDQPNTATIQYSCPGAGVGRTTITIETARLIDIETQGVDRGAPFADDYEGRRIGECAGGRR